LQSTRYFSYNGNLGYIKIQKKRRALILIFKFFFIILLKQEAKERKKEIICEVQVSCFTKQKEIYIIKNA